MSDHDEKDSGVEAAQSAQASQAEHAEHDFTGPLSAPVKRLLRVFFVISALLFLVDFFIDRKIHQPAERMPGFYALYGFVGCVVLVLAAKELRKVVMRPENYYDPRDDGGEER